MAELISPTSQITNHNVMAHSESLRTQGVTPATWGNNDEFESGLMSNVCAIAPDPTVIIHEPESGMVGGVIVPSESPADCRAAWPAALAASARAMIEFVEIFVSTFVKIESRLLN